MNHTLLSVDEFVARRNRFIEQMPDNSIAFFPAAAEVTRSNDTEYLFCQNKNFYYLTGFNEPDAILALVNTSQARESILFCRKKDAFQEVWHGRRIGAEKAKDEYQMEHSHSLENFELELLELLNGKSQVLFCQGEFPKFEEQLFASVEQLKSAIRQGKSSPDTFVDCAAIIHEMRLIKSNAELDIMRKANLISADAHHRAMEKALPEKFEYQIEAEILHEFARQGARFAAYNSIVAGGDNANILHYTDNQDALTSGDLLLIDAGAELAGYAADITRTFPVNGTFTEPQKALYQLVLDAQIAAIEAVKPGQTLAALNKIAAQVLTQGLFDLGILTGDIEQLLADNACKKYFIHGIGHWLGLDVHDVGDYQIVDKKQTRAFEPGMVMTIEPGLYIPLDDLDVDEQWRGIGIRIEDNILVTASGHENLSAAAVKLIADIEAKMLTQSKTEKGAN